MVGGAIHHRRLLHRRTDEGDQHVWPLDLSLTGNPAVSPRPCGHRSSEGRGELGATGSSLALVSWLSDRPTITRCLFGAGLLTELAPPLGLLNELILMLIGLGLIGLHQANGRLLGLPFPEYQLLVLIYLVNVPQLVR